MAFSFNKLQQIVNFYEWGQLDDAVIKNYENHYKKPMNEIIVDFKNAIDRHNHDVFQMKITDLRKLLKTHAQLSDDEKQKYVSASRNFEFDYLLEVAKRRVDEFDADKPNRQLRGVVKRLEDSVRSAKYHAIIGEDLVNKGLATYSPGIVSSDLMTLLEYKENYGDVLARIHHDFREKPRDVHTMPEAGFGSDYFHVSSDGEKIYISQATKKPYLEISGTVILDENQINHAMDLYRKLKHGYTFKQQPVTETAYWLGILKYLRISAK